MAEPHGTVTGIELKAGVDEKTQARACSTLAEIVSFPPVDLSTLGATEKLTICGGTGWVVLESAGVSVCAPTCAAEAETLAIGSPSTPVSYTHLSNRRRYGRCS